VVCLCTWFPASLTFVVVIPIPEAGYCFSCVPLPCCSIPLQSVFVFYQRYGRQGTKDVQLGGENPADLEVQVYVQCKETVTLGLFHTVVCHHHKLPHQ